MNLVDILKSEQSGLEYFHLFLFLLLNLPQMGESHRGLLRRGCSSIIEIKRGFHLLSANRQNLLDLGQVEGNLISVSAVRVEVVLLYEARFLEDLEVKTADFEC